jgi:hypothetical protein
MPPSALIDNERRAVLAVLDRDGPVVAATNANGTVVNADARPPGIGPSPFGAARAVGVAPSTRDRANMLLLMFVDAVPWPCTNISVTIRAVVADPAPRAMYVPLVNAVLSAVCVGVNEGTVNNLRDMMNLLYGTTIVGLFGTIGSND